MTTPAPTSIPPPTSSGRSRTGGDGVRTAQVTVPPPHAAHVDTVVARFDSHATDGLRTSQVEPRRAVHGDNELPQAKGPPWWVRLARQFNELVIWILIAAAVISGFIGDWIEAAAILAIVVLNGLIGFLQEEQAGRALLALQALSRPQAKVIREGRLGVVPSRELVPGDLLSLEAGDHVPADARLVHAESLRVHEAALTGESVPIDKTAHATHAAATPLADRANMIYMGTSVVAGHARAMVVATGVQTELGQIAGLLQRQQPEPTPLQRRLAELGRVLMVVCLAPVTIVFFLHLLRGGDLATVFLLAVSLAVAAVPEGLPAVITIALALGLQRMVKRHALIRRLPSVETLGSVTVICSDKTGTLTRNEMTVREIATASGVYEVTGSGYDARGEFTFRPDAPGVGPTGLTRLPDPELRQALTIGTRCNHAELRSLPGGGTQVVGDPTEGALLVAAAKAGLATTVGANDILAEIPFDSDRKAMSVVVPSPTGEPILLTKGAAEVVLAASTAEFNKGSIAPLSPERRQQILRRNAEMAARALRVLGLAYNPDPGQHEGRYVESDLVFVGLVGMIDPPRREAKTAVQTCRTAGVHPVMITGDHPAAALAIAREIGIVRDGERMMTGAELDQVPDDQLAARVRGVSAYARVTAAHKLRIIQAWRANGQIVAMTGDGVNDAPAVKAADIGIAMGVSGTDVTKEASDMVLTDDNFASIVNAIEEGRTILDNIRKVIHYLLASNASEILFMVFGALAGWPPPLLAIQILWINLVSDSLPALALAVEPPEDGVMSRPPRPPHEPVIAPGQGRVILWHGVLMAAAAALAFAVAYRGDDNNLPRARTVAFCTIALAQLFYAFTCRSPHRTLPQLGLLSNARLLGAILIAGSMLLAVLALPFARPVFGIAVESIWDWALAVGIALAPVTVVEVTKLLRRLPDPALPPIGAT